jgi:flagellar FliL protein
MMAESKEAAAAPKDGAKGKEAAAAKPAAKASGGKAGRKRLIIIAGAAAVLLGGAAAAYVMLKPQPAAPGTATAAKGADKAKEKKAEGERPLFVEFETFTSNTKDPEKFLQIKLTFQVKADKAVEGLKDLAPLVRSEVIPVLGAQDPPTLMTPEGKEKLSADLKVAANKALVGTGFDDSVDSVLITHMIIQ